MPPASGKLLPVLFTKRRNSGFPHHHRWRIPQIVPLAPPKRHRRNISIHRVAVCLAAKLHEDGINAQETDVDRWTYHLAQSQHRARRLPEIIERILLLCEWLFLH